MVEVSSINAVNMYVSLAIVPFAKFSAIRPQSVTDGD